MVEYTYDTDNIFESLADETRRDILMRVSQEELSITQIATDYDISMAAVSKHVQILESAGLITKRRDGQKRLVSFVATSIEDIRCFIDNLSSIDDSSVESIL